MQDNEQEPVLGTPIDRFEDRIDSDILNINNMIRINAIKVRNLELRVQHLEKECVYNKNKRNRYIYLLIFADLYLFFVALYLLYYMLAKKSMLDFYITLIKKMDAHQWCFANNL